MVCLSDLPNPAAYSARAPQPSSPSHPRIMRGETQTTSDVQVLDAIYDRLLNDYGDWGPDTLAAIADTLTQSGRMIVDVEAIGAEMIEDHHGWPIARIHADQMVGYIHQALDGGILVELFTRDADAADRLRVLVDGQPLHTGEPPEPIPAVHQPRSR